MAAAVCQLHVVTPVTFSRHPPCFPVLPSPAARSYKRSSPWPIISQPPLPTQMPVATFFLSVIMPFPLQLNWLPLSNKEEQMLDEEQAKEEASLFAEEASLFAEEGHDRLYALVAAQEDPALDECPDWNIRTHSIVWDFQHGYMQIPQEHARPCPHSTYRAPRAPHRLSVKEAWNEHYAAYASAVCPGDIFKYTDTRHCGRKVTTPYCFITRRNIRSWRRKGSTSYGAHST